MKVEIYTGASCTPCLLAKDFLRNKGIEFKELPITEEFNLQTLREKGIRTVPAIWIDGEYIGNYDHLLAHFMMLEDME